MNPKQLTIPEFQFLLQAMLDLRELGPQDRKDIERLRALRTYSRYEKGLILAFVKKHKVDLIHATNLQEAVA